LVVVAAILVALYALLEVAGGRAQAGTLSGAVHSSGAMIFGVSYILSWFAAILVAPPLAMTGLVLWGLARLR
jgi:hypothetical protein